MSLLPSGLENHPTGIGDLNAVDSANVDTIDSWMNPARGLTATQATTVVTASAAIFTSDDVGATIKFFNGDSVTVTAYTNATTVSVGTSRTETPAQAFWLYRTSETAETLLARALYRRARMLSSDDGTVPVWNTALKRYLAGSVASFPYAAVAEVLGIKFTQLSHTYASSMVLDFNAAGMETIAMTGNISFTTSNRGTGKSKVVRLDATVGGGGGSFTWPAWKFTTQPANQGYAGGSAVPPGGLTGGNTGILILYCFGTNESDVVAQWATDE